MPQLCIAVGLALLLFPEGTITLFLIFAAMVASAIVQAAVFLAVCGVLYLAFLAVTSILD
jgi:hypothetical protein